MDAGQRLPSSFRDPAGYLFRHQGTLYRWVSPSYGEIYDRLVSAGLLQQLCAAGKLVSHQEVALPDHISAGAHKLLQPQELPFISYPYEWSFGQLKDAGLLTLDVLSTALSHGFTLKDASAFNVQFHRGAPVFIDTLSFEPWVEGAPWAAYGQFCRHFLAPLALMSQCDIRLGILLRDYLDGIPLDLASRLLPWRTKFGLGLGLHIHLHAKAQSRYGGRNNPAGIKPKPVSRNGILGLVDSLRTTVQSLDWKPGGTEWFDYYQANNNYGDAALAAKEQCVDQFIAPLKLKTVWDLGGNTGRFSRIAAAKGASVVCWDIDPACVEANYQHARAHKETGVLPLLLDLTNPSPALGWAHQERNALESRGPADLVMALGLIHHLAISNNLPLPTALRFLVRLGRYLLIEFVPKEDSQVVKLLSSRPDIFPQYTQPEFESALAAVATIERKQLIEGTCRTLYLAKSETP